MAAEVRVRWSGNTADNTSFRLYAFADPSADLLLSHQFNMPYPLVGFKTVLWGIVYALEKRWGLR